MKKYLFIILSSIITSTYAQTSKKNTVFVEALGNGVLYSINYERIFQLSNHLKLAPRIGIEYIPRKQPNKYGNFSFPTEINLLYNRNNENPNYLETGLGLTYFSLFDNYKYDNFGNISGQKYSLAKVSTLRLGYRYQKPSGGFMYRAGLLVKLTQDEFSKSKLGDDLFYRLWPGASVGYNF